MIGCPACGAQDYSEVFMPVRKDRNHIETRCECQVCWELFTLVNQDNGDPYTIGSE